jgi:hypothetical protein
MAESLNILKDFPPVPTKACEAAIHVDLKGEDYHQKLVWNSDEGIVVRPSYRSEDIKDLESQSRQVPAAFPFVRGGEGTNKLIRGSARTARALPRFEPKTINGLRLAAGARSAGC